MKVKDDYLTNIKMKVKTKNESKSYELTNMKVRVKRENERAVSMRLKVEVDRSSVVSALALSCLSEVR